MIEKSTATVYKGAGRRFITLRAACKAEANKAMKKKYPCTCDSETGFVCDVHEFWLPNRDRYADLLEKRFKFHQARQNNGS